MSCVFDMMVANLANALTPPRFVRCTDHVEQLRLAKRFKLAPLAHSTVRKGHSSTARVAGALSRVGANTRCTSLSSRRCSPPLRVPLGALPPSPLHARWR